MNKEELMEYKTLWEVMRNKLGFSIDICDEIVDAVEEFLPKLEELVVEPSSMEDLVLKEDIEPLDPYTIGFGMGVETALTEIYKKLR
jgi:hypothetical protein